MVNAQTGVLYIYVKSMVQVIICLSKATQQLAQFCSQLSSNLDPDVLEEHGGKTLCQI